MLTCIYVVEKIDGDYAELRRVDALKHDGRNQDGGKSIVAGRYHGRE